MADVSKFSMFGQDINIKDSTARTEIAAANSNISNINNDISNVKASIQNIVDFTYTVFVGDSYLQGYLLDNPSTQNWGYKFAEIVKPQKTAYLADGGLGFCNSGQSSGLNAANFVQSRSGSIDNKDSVTAVVVCLGFNDRGYDDGAIRTNCAAFWTVIKNVFPNAKPIYFINPAFGSMARNKIGALYETSAIGGAITIESWWWLLINTAKFESDCIHPNENGQWSIALHLYTSLHGGKMYTYAYYNLNPVQGWQVILTTRCDSMQIYVNGNYPPTKEYLQIGSWGDKIFIASGGNGASNGFRSLIPFNNGPYDMGFVQWYAGGQEIWVNAMSKLNENGFSSGSVNFYREIDPSMIFG